MILEYKLVGPTTDREEESEPAFESKAAVALENSDIQVDEKLCSERTQVDTVPIMVENPH